MVDRSEKQQHGADSPDVSIGASALPPFAEIQRLQPRIAELHQALSADGVSPNRIESLIRAGLTGGDLTIFDRPNDEFQRAAEKILEDRQVSSGNRGTRKNSARFDAEDRFEGNTGSRFDVGSESDDE